jgi:hypothetical protein
MILKGNQRGGGQQLAAHLMNSFDNDRVEVAEVSGAVAQDLSGAFAEWSAQARATKMKKKFYYSLSLNPDQAQGRLTREQYFDMIARTERALGLEGQPRAVVFHEKRDGKGVPREHCHVVWSRVDMRQEKIKSIQIAHDKLKIRTVTQEFCRDHGLQLPERMKPGRSKGSRVDRFNDSANLAEKQQQERTGISIPERKADIATCWRETGNGAAFVAALEGKGYFLACGDSRDYVVLDLHGEVHSLSRQLKGVARPKEMRNRLLSHPADKLPDVVTTQMFLEKKRRDAIRAAVAQKDPGPTDIELRRRALEQHQQARRATLDTMRIDLIRCHMTEREGLKAAHEAQNAGIATARLKKQPKGIMAFVARVTGIQLIVEARQKMQDKARAAEHKQQAETLGRTHGRELAEMDRRYRALSRLELREDRSAERAFKRAEFQLLLKKQPQQVLKPEFDRAAQPARGRTGTEDGKPLKETFDKAAKPPLDLTEAFNREVENRLRREDRDRDPDGPDRGFDPRKR